MKKILFSALLFIPILGWSQGYNFSLNISAKNLNPTTKAYMSYLLNGEQTLDSAQLKDGMFRFKGTVLSPTLAIVALDHTGAGIKLRDMNFAKDMCNVYLEDGNIMISVTDSIKSGKVTGSKLNDEYAKYVTYLAPYQKKLMDAYQLVANHAYGNTEEDQKIMKTGLAAAEVAKKAKSEMQFKYIKANPGSYLSLVALEENAGKHMDVHKMETIFNGLNPEIRNTVFGQNFAKQIAATYKTNVGDVAPQFTQNDVNGNPVKLSDFKGKYVLVDFWATWCGPCRAENPNLVKAYAKYKDRNFTILSVSVDELSKKGAWLEAIKKDGLIWPQVADLKGLDNVAARDYGIRAIPQNFLVDPNGVIVAKNLRGEALLKNLETILPK